MIAIVDYGVGNIYSLERSLSYVGAESVITGDKSVIQTAGAILLPGVGAFGDAIAKLRQNGLDEVITAEAKKGKPVMGICLGMQLLYEESCEYGIHKGLGLIPGAIRNMAEDMSKKLKVPHMGWNNITKVKQCPILDDTADSSYVYFVHSYYAPVSGDTVASVNYGELAMTAAVQRDNVFATQFHPEKSGEVGLSMLRAFAKIKA